MRSLHLFINSSSLLSKLRDLSSTIFQQFLDGEIANNQEKEKKISLLERQSAKFRLDYQNNENARILFQDEVSLFPL